MAAYDRQGPEASVSAARKALAISGDDSNDLAVVSRAIMVNVAGNVKVTLADDSAAVTLAVLPGQIYPFAVARLWSTGTTATGVHALY